MPASNPSPPPTMVKTSSSSSAGDTLPKHQSNGDAAGAGKGGGSPSLKAKAKKKATTTTTATTKKKKKKSVDSSAVGADGGGEGGVGEDGTAPKKKKKKKKAAEGEDGEGGGEAGADGAAAAAVKKKVRRGGVGGQVGYIHTQQQYLYCARTQGSWGDVERGVVQERKKTHALCSNRKVNTKFTTSIIFMNRDRRKRFCRFASCQPLSFLDISYRYQVLLYSVLVYVREASLPNPEPCPMFSASTLKSKYSYGEVSFWYLYSYSTPECDRAGVS